MSFVEKRSSGENSYKIDKNGVITIYCEAINRVKIPRKKNTYSKAEYVAVLYQLVESFLCENSHDDTDEWIDESFDGVVDVFYRFNDADEFMPYPREEVASFLKKNISYDLLRNIAKYIETDTKGMGVNCYESYRGGVASNRFRFQRNVKKVKK